MRAVGIAALQLGVAVAIDDVGQVQPGQPAVQGRGRPVVAAVGLGQEALDEAAALLVLQVHRGAGELVHQSRRHGLPAGHGEDQAFAVGRQRLASVAVDHAAQHAGAQVGHQFVGAEAGGDFLQRIVHGKSPAAGWVCQ